MKGASKTLYTAESSSEFLKGGLQLFGKMRKNCDGSCPTFSRVQRFSPENVLPIHLGQTRIAPRSRATFGACFIVRSAHRGARVHRLLQLAVVDAVRLTSAARRAPRPPTRTRLGLRSPTPLEQGRRHARSLRAHALAERAAGLKVVDERHVSPLSRMSGRQEQNTTLR